MPIHSFSRPGQKKIARYIHTQSCARLTGITPPVVREAQFKRRLLLPVIAFLLLLAGVLAFFF